jgi:hypothetical protein
MTASANSPSGTRVAAQLDPLVLPAGTAIHMIAFAEHCDAKRFVREMERHANQLRRGVARATIVATKDQFLRALRAETDLMLVSAHGPRAMQHEPVIGDGNEKNRVDLRDLGHVSPFVFGARAGIIWDACYTGCPKFGFVDEFARLSAAGVVHDAPVDEIKWDHSVHLATTILDELMAVAIPPIMPASFAAAAATAAASSQIELWHGPLRPEGAS